MAAPTANQIKTQIKTLLTPVIGTSSTKKTKIFDYLALAFRPPEGEDPTILRSLLDMIPSHPSGRVNCLMISEQGFSQARVPRKEDSTRVITHARGKNIISRQFFVTYFYEFGLASENVFSENVELVRSTLNANPKLGFPVLTGAGEWVEGHDGLQVPLMPADYFGSAALHVAEGTLTVRLIEALG